MRGIYIYLFSGTLAKLPSCQSVRNSLIIIIIEGSPPKIVTLLASIISYKVGVTETLAGTKVFGEEFSRIVVGAASKAIADVVATLLKTRLI